MKNTYALDAVMTCGFNWSSKRSPFGFVIVVIGRMMIDEENR